ncbi:hypothetical protein Q8W71_13800 [Methylobacterium sp. NEAU 140]|uniref:hypothetical protein n=1 Tax=Methylobacterium sp. NEAU 140 TaxID=3064945 RepID=UPI002733EE95|nr:hypothetical protein [Methylobacterium sp. NEAU 140]MDP4023705.1 hypothetical protein [Methylobacterium sp. NEAU 140]
MLTTHAGAIRRLKAAGTRDQKMVAFEAAYEGAGVKAYGSRHRYANEAERAFNADEASKKNPVSAKPSTIDYKDFLNRRAPDHIMQLPGQAQAAAASISNTASSSTTSNDFRINEVNVHTKATDADGIARDLGPAMRRTFTTAQANYGPA